MNGALHLTIATPEATIVDARDIRSIRAVDASGGFGLLPGHADLLTVLPASVVGWRAVSGARRYCAVRGGVLTVTAGKHVAVAARQAQLGERLDVLEADIAAARASESDADRIARVAQMRLHARAIRQLMRFLAPDTPDGLQSLFKDGRA